MGAFSLFSSVSQKHYAERLEGESYTAMFGSTKIDFTQRPLAAGSHSVSVLAMFGSVTLVFPSDVDVRLEAIPLFGSASLRDETPPPLGAPQVTVQGLIMFGDLTVRRVPAGLLEAQVAELPALEQYDRPADEPYAYEGETQRLERR